MLLLSNKNGVGFRKPFLVFLFSLSPPKSKDWTTYVCINLIASKTLDFPCAFAPNIPATGKIFSLAILMTLSENSDIFVALKSRVVSSLNDLKFLKLNCNNILLAPLNDNISYCFIYYTTYFLFCQQFVEVFSQYNVFFQILYWYPNPNCYITVQILIKLTHSACIYAIQNGITILDNR